MAQLEAENRALQQRTNELQQQVALERATVKGLLADLAEATSTWTTEKPTGPGWYWLRNPHDGITQVVFVYEGNVGLWVEFLDGLLQPIRHTTGEWAKVPSPKERGEG